MQPIERTPGAIGTDEDEKYRFFVRFVDMKVGQLVQVESFSLFDAMCAIVVSVLDRPEGITTSRQLSLFSSASIDHGPKDGHRNDCG